MWGLDQDRLVCPEEMFTPAEAYSSFDASDIHVIAHTAIQSVVSVFSCAWSLGAAWSDNVDKCFY